MALYNELRPQRFSDVVGQETITTVLKNAVRDDKLAQTYLFVGDRGTGKTSVARILAEAVNCEHSNDGEPCQDCESCRSIRLGRSMSVYELDAARNRGVDAAQQLIENASLPPVSGRKKVFIIDEVHMLTTEAFNTLLKTLEEPPKWCLFILCTTELQKVPQTIVSRSMTFRFRLIKTDVIETHLRKVMQERGVPAEEEALNMIATAADGSMRDALSILEKCLTGQEKLTAEFVRLLQGYTDTESVTNLLLCLAQKDIAGIYEETMEFRQKGTGITVFLDAVLNALIAISGYLLSGVLHGTEKEKAQTEMLSDAFSVEKAFFWIDLISAKRNELIRTSNPYLIFTAVILSKMTEMQEKENLQEQVQELKEIVESQQWQCGDAGEIPHISEESTNAEKAEVSLEESEGIQSEISQEGLKQAVQEPEQQMQKISFSSLLTGAGMDETDLKGGSRSDDADKSASADAGGTNGNAITCEEATNRFFNSFWTEDWDE